MAIGTSGKQSIKERIATRNAAKNAKRNAVNQHYAEVANNVRIITQDENQSCSSASSCSCKDARRLYPEQVIDGVPQAALLASRGCGNPFDRTCLKEGDTVLDLGCGGGIDVLLAAQKVGESGHVTGVDMTEEMLQIARENQALTNITNVDFVQGYLEHLPFDDNSFDCVISNCVINLCEDKSKVLAEALRVLKPLGCFVVADIAFDSAYYQAQSVDSAAAILGCTSGVLDIQQYRGILNQLGFLSSNIEIYRRYPYETLQEKAQQKGLQQDLAAYSPQYIDNAFCGVYVTAYK
jgi:arsenite methyltransferase